MVNRKGISKKLRFEIFKRDGFACAYCGKTPPNATLEIDHIDPFSKGGECCIDNYITACFDCNRGKSNIKLTVIPNKISENLEILKAKEEQLKEYRKFIKSIKVRKTRDINKIAKIYSEYFKHWKLNNKFKTNTIGMFLEKLPLHEVEESMEMAVSKMDDCDTSIKYFCGICWNKIKGL